MKTLSAFLLPLLVLSACASAGEQASGGGSYDDPITREEIAGTDYETAYDVVRGERSRWLRRRGNPSSDLNATALVYVNGVRRGGPAELRNIPVTAVREIRYYDSREATTRFGTGHPLGAIEVVM